MGAAHNGLPLPFGRVLSIGYRQEKARRTHPPISTLTSIFLSGWTFLCNRGMSKADFWFLTWTSGWREISFIVEERDPGGEARFGGKKVHSSGGHERWGI